MGTSTFFFIDLKLVEGAQVGPTGASSGGITPGPLPGIAPGPSLLLVVGSGVGGLVGVFVVVLAGFLISRKVYQQAQIKKMNLRVSF